MSSAAWREAILSNNPRHYFLMAIIFNALNVIQLATLFKLNRGQPFLGVELIAFVFFLTMLGYCAWALYRHIQDMSKGEPEGSPKAKAFEQLTYRGYRLYLMGLGNAFIILSAFNLVARLK